MKNSKVLYRTWMWLMRRDEIRLLDKTKQGNTYFGYSEHQAELDFGQECIRRAVRGGLIYVDSSYLGGRYLYTTPRGSLLGVTIYEKESFTKNTQRNGKYVFAAICITATLTLTVLRIFGIFNLLHTGV